MPAKLSNKRPPAKSSTNRAIHTPAASSPASPKSAATPTASNPSPAQFLHPPNSPPAAASTRAAPKSNPTAQTTRSHYSNPNPPKPSAATTGTSQFPNEHCSLLNDFSPLKTAHCLLLTVQ